MDISRLDTFIKAYGKPDLIPIQGKIPRDKDWLNIKWPQERLDSKWAGGSNAGCRLSKIDLVIDFDVKHLDDFLDPDPEDFMEAFLKKYGIEDTLVVKTASGGYHAYLRKDPTVPVKRYRAEDPDWGKIVEIKADKGQVVAPGSEIKGNHYEVIRPGPPMTCPPKLMTLLKKEIRARDSSYEELHFNGEELMTHLDMIPTDEFTGDYDGWLKVGMACHSATEGEEYGLELWEEWSAKDSSYDETGCKYKWDTFQNSGIDGSYLKGIIKRLGGKVPPKTARQQFRHLEIREDETLEVTDKLLWPRLVETVADTGFVQDSKSGPKLTRHCLFTELVCQAACIEIGIQYDIFLGLFITKPGTTLPWNPKLQWSENSDSHLRSFLSPYFPCEEEIKEQHWNMAMKAMTGKPGVAVNILEDQILNVKWDGTPRVEDFLSVYFGCPDDFYTASASKLFLCGLIARCLDPGVKFDLMLCIEGDQGLSKSSMLEILAGDIFFTDANPFIMTSENRRIEAIRGKWIVEIPEMKGIVDGDTADIKSFLTRRADEMRGAYARFRTRAPRTVVFVGTCNIQHYLNDPTGNRRFLPVVATKANKDLLRKDRDQLLAEAVAIYKSEGQKCIYIQEGSEMQKLQKIETDKRRITSEVEEELGRYFDSLRSSTPKRSSADWLNVHTSLKEKLGRGSKLTWSTILPLAQKLGWQGEGIGANRVLTYKHPVKIVRNFEDEENL